MITDAGVGTGRAVENRMYLIRRLCEQFAGGGLGAGASKDNKTKTKDQIQMGQRQ